MAEQEEDFSTIPLAKRVAHSSWKARVHAIEEIVKKTNYLEDGDNAFLEYVPIAKKLVSDKNAVVQERALDIVVVLIDRAKVSGKFFAEFAPLLIEKCLAGKASTRDKALQSFHLFIETEQNNAMIAELVKNFSQKNAKIAQSCLQAVKDAVHAFGVKVINPKPILKELPVAFDHTDKKVREEAMGLALELHRWLGQALMPHLESLKPIIRKDLDDQIAQAPQEPACPTHCLRSQKLSDTVAQSGAAQGSAAPEIDPLDLVDAVDILSQLPSDWHSRVEEKKWSDRKDAVVQLAELANKPKLAAGDYSEVVKALKKIINKDANVAVVVESCKAVANLATGLRKDFAQYARILCTPLLGRLKDKKNVTDVAVAALDAMASSGCIQVTDVLEDITAAMNAKSPQAKALTLQWVGRCLKLTSKQALGKSAKPFGTQLVSCMEDGAGEVRDAACVAFGAFAGLVGERAVLPFIEKFEQTNKVMHDKIKSFFPSATGQTAPANAVPATTAAPPSAPPAARRPSTPAVESAKETVPIKRPASANVLSTADKTADHKPAAAPKPPGLRRPSTALKDGGAKSKKKPAAEDEEEADAPAMSNEEAEAKAAELFEESVRSQLSSKDWKERLNGVETLGTIVEGMSPADRTANVDVIIRFVLDKSPGYSDVNAQVCAKVFGITALLARTVSKFPKRCAAVVIPTTAAKLAEPKNKQPATDMLNAFSERLGPQFVFSQLYKVAPSHKNPAVTAAVLSWIAQTIQDFGTAGVKIADLINVMKICLEATNPKIKASAVDVLVETRKRKGPSVRDFLADVKPQLLTTIDSAFSKVVDENVPPPSKSIIADESVAAVGEDEPLEAPRADISGQITAQLLKDLGDANWKLRQGALQQITDILAAANNRIQPKVGELLAGMKGRMQDSNKNLLQTAITLFGQLATAMGKAFEKNVKIFGPSVMANWCDNKKTVRDAVTQCMDAWVLVAGVDTFVTLMPATVIVDAPAGRKEALAWIAKHLPNADNKTNDVTPLIKPVLACLEDRTGEVRQAAASVLEVVVKVCGLPIVRKTAKEFKPASLAIINPILDQFKSSELPPPAAPEVSASPTKKKEEGAPAGRPRAMSKSRISQPVLKKEEAVAVAAALVSNDKKEARARADKKQRWAFEETRSEHVDILREQAQACVNDVLHAKMFSTDFKKHAEALGDMTVAVQQQQKEALESADVLLKWCTLRLCEGNMTTLLKALEFLRVLFGMMQSQGYMLSEYEAAAVSPFIVAQTGNNNEKVRSTVRQLLKVLCLVYPASRVFQFVIDGLKSKNSRVRAECLEELSDILGKFGMDVVVPGKNLPVIGQQLSERDSNIRTAAANFLVQVYEVIGADIWKYLGKLPDASREALEMKFSGRGPAAAPTAAAPSGIRPPSRARGSVDIRGSQASTLVRQQTAPSKMEFALELEKTAMPATLVQPSALPPLEIIETPAKTRTPTLPGRPILPETPAIDKAVAADALNVTHTAETMSAPMTPTADVTASARKRRGKEKLVINPTVSDLDSWIALIRATDDNEEAQKLQIRKLFETFTSYRSVFDQRVDESVHALTDTLQSAYLAEPPRCEVIKYALNMLIGILQSPELVNSFSKSRLVSLSLLALCLFLDKTKQYPADVAHNVDKASKRITLILAIPSQANIQYSFSVLLQIMTKAVSNQVKPAYLAQGIADACSKAIFKSLRSELLPEVDSVLLQGFHECLVAHEQAGLAKDSCRSFNSCRYLLKSMCKKLDRSILHLIPSTVEEESLLIKSISFYLNERSTGVATPAPVARDALAADEPTPAPTQAPTQALAPTKSIPYEQLPAAAKAELNAVCARLRDASQTEMALHELADFRDRYPGFDVHSVYAATSWFRDYIDRGLRRVEAQRAGKKEISAVELAAAATQQLANVRQRLGKAPADKPVDKENAVPLATSENIAQPPVAQKQAATSDVTMTELRAKLARLQAPPAPAAPVQVVAPTVADPVAAQVTTAASGDDVMGSLRARLAKLTQQ